MVDWHAFWETWITMLLVLLMVTVTFAAIGVLVYAAARFVRR